MNLPRRRANILLTPAGRDALVLLTVGAMLFLIASCMDIFEIMIEFTARYEQWEIDEFLIVVLLLSAGLAIFSLRRWNELKTEIQARTITQERLNLAIEGGSLGVWDWNVTTGELSIIHDWFHDRTFPSSEEETHVSIFEECIHPDDRPLLIKGMEEVRDDAMPYYEAECREQCQGGGWRWVHVCGKVTGRDEVGHPIRATGITRDVTEMHRTREALEEANRKLDLLYSITRHDLLNQISIIAAYIGLIEEEVNSGRLREYTRHVAAATATIRDQIVFMHDYESMGVKAPEWQCVDEIARAAGEQASHGDLAIKALTGRVEVFADPLFEKVLFNLVDNTLRHGEGATRVRVSFHEENDEGVIVYEDDGKGVPAGIKEKIFSRGFGRQGSGLGLFLVREILGITGMTIQEMGEEGKGARFEIVVPAGAFRTDRQ